MSYQITSTTTGIVLSNSTTQNPATVVAGAYVTNTTTSENGDAVYGTTAAAWNVTNLDTINATATASVGALLEAGGTVTNATSASITGGFFGIAIVGGGTVSNYGTITGPSGAGIFLEMGGVIVNAATNATSALIAGGKDGVFISGSAGTVSNFGTIAGTSLDGIYLMAGGSIRNAQGALISGGAGVYILGTAGAVSNYGTITGTSGDGIYLMAGGHIANGDTAAVIAGGRGAPGSFPTRLDGSAGRPGVGVLGGGSITNSGTIVGGTGGAGAEYGTGGAGGIGVNLSGGGAIANAGWIGGGAGGAGGSEGSGPEEISLAGGTGGIGINLSDAGSIANTGTIVGGQGAGGLVGLFGGAPAEAGGAGISLLAGGSVLNTGTIVGGKGGSVFTLVIYSYGGAGGAGVSLLAGGSVLNTGTIAGGQGGSVSYNGTSGAGGTGITLAAGGSVTNGSAGAAAALISGGIGIEATGTSGATVTNYGTIAGRSGTAVRFGSGNDRLIVDPGAVFSGNVDGGTGSNTLELASAANAGTLSGIGSQFLNFGSITFDTAANWLIAGDTAGLAASQIITGFTTADTIDLTGFVAVSESFSNNELLLTDTASNTATLDIQGSFTTSSFMLTPDGGTGTDVTIACFCRGTRILTDKGEVAVEALGIGDRVVTFSGAVRPVKWIGRRSYDARFVAGNPAVSPICIMAGALSDGVPARDLFVSPEHALYIDGVLVPARLLVNAATIVQVEEVEQIEYCHIELETHDMLLAEGAPAETFVDCDNRLMFQNAGEFAALYPDDLPAPWEFCAPRLDEASVALSAIRAALLQRAALLGYGLTDDPDLHLVVDGRAIWPESIAGDRYRFRIPAGSAAVSLASRSAVPAEIEAEGCDIRRLGVALKRIALFDAERSIEARHDDDALGDGFHPDEGTHRWTDGRARLPESWLRSLPGALTLEVQLTPTGLCYRVPPPARISSAAA